MHIIYFWEGEGQSREPNCRTDVIGSDGVDFLACLLTDHGGQNYQSTIDWLDEGLSRIDLVKHGVIGSSEWDRDSWGVEIKDRKAKIYSLYDDGCFSIIDVEDFERALFGWRQFILAG